MADSALKYVTLRNAFYRDSFRRIVWVLLISLLANLALAGALVYAIKHQPKPVYFATTSNGKLFRLQGLQRPILSDAAIKAWVTEKVPQVFNVDFLNLRADVARSRQYFTSYGWNQFVKAFNPTLERVKRNDLVVQATVTDVPYISREYIHSGVYTWEVQVPLLVTYQQGQYESKQHVIWDLLLQRVSGEKTGQLVGIAQVISQTNDANG